MKSKLRKFRKFVRKMGGGTLGIAILLLTGCGSQGEVDRPTAYMGAVNFEGSHSEAPTRQRLDIQPPDIQELPPLLQASYQVPPTLLSATLGVRINNVNFHSDPTCTLPIPDVPSEGDVSYAITSRLAGLFEDDGVQMSLGPTTFSGIPSGPDVYVAQIAFDTRYTRFERIVAGRRFEFGLIRHQFVSNNRTDMVRIISLKPSTLGVSLGNAISPEFDFGAGQNATLSFDISPTGTPRPEVHQWSVAVRQPNGQLFHQLPASAGAAGPGRASVRSGGLHVEVPWDGRNASGNPIEGDFQWVMAANVTNVAGGGQPGQAGQATLTLAQVKRGLTIKNAQADPGDFDPAEGGNTTLSFDMEAQGLGVNPQFSWEVTIVANADDSLLYTFPIPNGQSGPGQVSSPSSTTSRHVDLVWNGKDAQGQAVTPDFTWVLKAQAQAPGGPSNRAQTSVVNAGPPQLEILGDAAGDSTRKGIVSFDTVDAKYQQGWSDYQQFLDAFIYPYGRRGCDNTLLIRARNIPREDSSTTPPPPLKVKVLSYSGGGLDQFGLETGLDEGVELELAWNSAQQYYEGRLLVDSRLIKDDFPPGGTGIYGGSFFFGDGFSYFNWLTHTLQSGRLSQGLPNTAYPEPLVSLGRCGRSFRIPFVFDNGAPRTGPIPVVLPDRTQVYPNGNGLRCMGFEPVRFELISDQVSLSANLKVRHPASVVSFDTHGGHEGGLMVAPEELPLLSNGQPFAEAKFGQFGNLPHLGAIRQAVGNLTVAEPQDSAALRTLDPLISCYLEDFSHLRTLFLTGCQLLDHLDYNNNFHPQPNDPITGSVEARLHLVGLANSTLLPDPRAGGDRWFEATVRGQASGGGHPVLLGYNRMVANDTQLVAETYQEEYRRLAAAGVVVRNLETWAWMWANFRVGFGEENHSSLAACAWDNDYYYYISHGRVWDDVSPDYDMTTLVYDPRTSRVRRIPRSRWYEAPEDWNEAPDFAEVVPIPNP